MTAEEETPQAEAPKRPKPGPTARRRARAEKLGVPVESLKPQRPTVLPSPGGRRTRLETEVGAMLVQMNLGFTLTCALAPGLDPTKDPLQPNEITLLAKGVAAQAEAHAQFRKYLNYLLTVSGSAGLFSVVAAIVTVRLAAHGVIPEQAGVMASLALQADPAAVAALTAQIINEGEEEAG